jgi:predicted dehydrogenase
LRIRVYGSEASLDWRQEAPNHLRVRYVEQPEQVYKHGNDYLDEVSPIAQHNSRLPFGHNEAFIEAFANVYQNAGRTIAARIAGEEPSEFDLDFPTVQDGAIGVHFIHTAIASGKDQSWVDARYTPPGG